MPHGLGHKARRDAARSAARTPTRADSTDPRYWPAPRWTHAMADEAAATNDRRYADAQSGAYIPPSREPVTEAWGELAAQRDAETVHRLDLALAREQMQQVEDEAVLGQRTRRDASPVPPQEWAAKRAAARAAACGLCLSPSEPGATRPLGPGKARSPQ